jgi:hypothetical protein
VSRHYARVTDQASVTLRALAEGFKGRSSPEADHLVGAALDDRIAMAVDLIDHGEPVVAFENPCTNLYEYELPISADEHQQLAALGEQSGVTPDRYDFLAELVRA